MISIRYLLRTVPGVYLHVRQSAMPNESVFTKRTVPASYLILVRQVLFTHKTDIRFPLCKTWYKTNRDWLAMIVRSRMRKMVNDWIPAFAGMDLFYLN